MSTNNDQPNNDPNDKDKKDDPPQRPVVTKLQTDTSTLSFLSSLEQELKESRKVTKELGEKIEKMETERKNREFKTHLQTAREELKRIDPRLFEIYKDEMDLNTIQKQIKTAKLYKHGFPEFDENKKENDKDKKDEKPVVKNYLNPLTNQWE